MRKLTTTLAVIAVLGWAVSAQAGTINSTWDLSNSSGNTYDTQGGNTIPAGTMAGTLCLTFSNAASTKSSIPRSQSTISMGCLTSTATGTYAGIVQATLKAKLKTAITGLHLSANGSFAGSQTANLQVTETAHCQSAFLCLFAPGSWPSSQVKTNMFTAAVHLPSQVYNHTASSKKVLGSGVAKIASPNSHLVSSQGGYHTMHLQATQK